MTDPDDNIMNYLDNQMKVEEKIDTSEEIIGIDLGTTNSCVGVWRNNNFHIITDEHGNHSIPSYVAYTKLNKYIGLEAKNQEQLNPKNVFYEFKRYMGCKITDESVKNDLEFYNYDIVGDPDTNSVNVITEWEQRISPEELSSMILYKLKTMASKYLKISAVGR